MGSEESRAVRESSTLEVSSIPNWVIRGEKGRKKRVSIEDQGSQEKNLEKEDREKKQEPKRIWEKMSVFIGKRG